MRSNRGAEPGRGEAWRRPSLVLTAPCWHPRRQAFYEHYGYNRCTTGGPEELDDVCEMLRAQRKAGQF